MELNKLTNTGLSLTLRSIADREIMKIPFVRDCSLADGMIGMAIFFASISIALDNKAYESIAEYLLNRVCEEIPEDISLDFLYGITGIGWGLFFLKECGFIDSDIDSILEDVDELILDRLNKCKEIIIDPEVKKGVCIYIYSRLNHTSEKYTLQEDSILARLKKKFDCIGISTSNGCMESLNIWKECLDYWRKSNPTDDSTWGSGLVIMDDDSCYSNIINISHSTSSSVN